MGKTCVILMLVVLLTGCTNESTELERGMALRSKILQAKQISFTMDIAADYGDSVQLFSMESICDADGNISFTVISPETISGITGSISEGQGKITFDDTALYIPLLTDGQINPVSAPWILMRTLRSGYLSSAGLENDQLRLSIYDTYEDNALLLDIWLDSQDLPQSVAVCYDGRTILTLAVKNYEIM